jgi:hypothetical protein
MSSAWSSACRVSIDSPHHIGDDTLWCEADLALENAFNRSIVPHFSIPDLKPR